MGVEGGGEREREKTEAFMTAAAVMAVLSGGCMGWVGVGVEGGGEREREKQALITAAAVMAVVSGHCTLST